MRDLPTLLRAGDTLVVNDTKVFPASLSGRRLPRSTGRRSGTGHRSHAHEEGLMARVGPPLCGRQSGSRRAISCASAARERCASSIKLDATVEAKGDRAVR